MAKKVISAVLCFIMVLSTISAMAIATVAANYTTNYSNYDPPENSGDYAYWNGSSVKKSTSTTKDEIRWMQASMNYLISVGYISGSYLDVDGSFGPASKALCKKFQAKASLSQDGSFGPGTIKKMKSVLDYFNKNKTENIIVENTNISVESIKKQITNTYSNAKSLANVSSFSGKCGTYVKSQLHVLGIINQKKDTDCSGNGNKFYGNVKSGTTSTGYTKTKVNGGANCLANIVKTYGKNITNIVISYPHQYGYTNSNPGYGHVVFIHAIINGTVYYSDNYKVGKVAEGGVLTKTVAQFDSAYTKSYGNALGAIYFHK